MKTALSCAHCTKSADIVFDEVGMRETLSGVQFIDWSGEGRENSPKA